MTTNHGCRNKPVPDSDPVSGMTTNHGCRIKPVPDSDLVSGMTTNPWMPATLGSIPAAMAGMGKSSNTNCSIDGDSIGLVTVEELLVAF